jgi:cytochrome bd-type quinol oxidase subunit 2
MCSHLSPLFNLLYLLHSKESCYCLPIIFGATAFGLGVAGTISCDFMTTADSNTSLGIWCEQSTSSSSNEKIARAFSVLALVSGGLFLLMDIGMMAMSPNRNRLYRSGGMNYMICSLFAGLTLLMLNSSLCSDDGGCRISKGAKIIISSTVMWFASGVSVMMLYPPWIKREITRDEEPPGLGPSITDLLMA